MSSAITIVTPLLFHMIVSEITAVLFGQYLDAAACTMAASLLVIPGAVWMYLQDIRKEAQKGEKGPAKCDRNSPGAWKQQKNIIFGFACFAAGGALNVAWSGLLNLLHIHQYFSNQTQEALLAGQAAVQIIGLGFLVPLAEELIFRALIYRRMKRFFSARWAIFFSALLFAIYHGNPIQMIFAFPMALALAAVYERGKLFGFPLLFHMGANLTAVFLNFFI